MSIIYTSPHHCPEDPGGLVRETLDLGAGFPGPAEDVLVSWSLRLEDGLTPQAASTRLLKRLGLIAGPLPEGACGHLVELLRQATKDTPKTPSRRRGGWRSRRN